MTMIFDCGASAYERVAGVETPFEPMAAMFFFAEIGRVLRRHYSVRHQARDPTRAPAALAHPYAAAGLRGHTTRNADEALSKCRSYTDALGGRGGITKAGLADAPPACIPFELPADRQAGIVAHRPRAQHRPSLRRSTPRDEA